MWSGRSGGELAQWWGVGAVMGSWRSCEEWADAVVAARW